MGSRRPVAEGNVDAGDRGASRHLRRHRSAPRQRSPRQARCHVPPRALAAHRDERKRGGTIDTLPSSPRPDGVRTKALHEQYAKSIFNYCLRRLRSREEAEDAAQIVFLNAHRCLEEGIEPQSERAWLFKIAEHVVMYRRRTISRRARVEFPVDVDALADLVVAPGRDARAELDGLPEALARIPEAQQRAIVLREWDRLSYREVAAELGISTSAAETLIFRALRRLARELGGPWPTVRLRARARLDAAGPQRRGHGPRLRHRRSRAPPPRRMRGWRPRWSRRSRWRSCFRRRGTSRRRNRRRSARSRAGR